jgi:hypothetical protein
MAFKMTYFLVTGIFVSKAGKRSIGWLACGIHVVRSTVDSLAIKYFMSFRVMEYPV